MSRIVRIFETDDWIVVTYCGEEIYHGHSIPTHIFVNILMTIQDGYDSIRHYDLTMEQMENWKKWADENNA